MPNTLPMAARLNPCCRKSTIIRHLRGPGIFKLRLLYTCGAGGPAYLRKSVRTARVGNIVRIPVKSAVVSPTPPTKCQIPVIVFGGE
jgi:hypothetical protein